MDQGAVVGLARSAFPEVIDHPAGGTLRLPSGTHLGRYVTPFAAQVDLPGGKHAVVESFSAIAAPAGHGEYTPLDLFPKQTGGVYAPATSDVAVRIPKQLRGGVAVPGSGVSITPVSAQGAPLQGSEGVLDGSSVLFANTQTDTDTLIRPTPAGFDLDSELRSVRSPWRLYFHLDLPRDARLAQGPRGSHMMRVIRDGTVIATILPPSGQDADGLPVPVSMSASGHTLDVSVHKTELNDFPIVVDPEVIDSKVTEPSRWKFGPPSTPHFVDFEYENWLEVESTGEYPATEHAFISYQTQGDSHIYFVGTYLKVQNEGNMEAILELDHESSGKEVSEDTQLVAAAHQEVYTKTYFKVCAEYSAYPTCPLEGKWTEYGAEHNEAKLQESATAAGSGYNHANLLETNVWIAQPKGPEQPVFNTTEEYLKNDANRRNVFYGSGGWISAYSGGYEVKAKDAGVGVSKFTIRSPGLWKETYEYLKEGLCEGVQCREEVNPVFSYNKELPNGEDTIEVETEDATVSFSPEVHAVLKVDDTLPHGIKLKGMPESGAELSATQHEITLEASDGEGSVPSSGIKSISASVDGKEIGQPAGYCTPGPCTATGKWTLNGESFGAGIHQLVVTATSNSGTEAKEEYTFAVRNATPSALGPGTVDPVSGQFALSATDVSLAGVGGVARSYQSRDLTAGGEGPLGSQWSLSLGTGQRLTILADGDAILVGSSAGLTAFTHKENGEFESPQGDSNLKLEFEPKGRVYLLKDAAQDTTMKFTQEGIENTTPTYAGQLTSAGSRPVSDAVDSSGNIWATDYANDRILKYSQAGVLLDAYGAPGSGIGQFLAPWGIAINSNTGNVYVTDDGNNRIVELSSSGVFIKAMGWGVSDGKAEYEVCTSICKAGIAGAGTGQFKVLAGVTIDSSGNIWVADDGNNRIQEFNEKGEHLQTFGSEGSGDGQFNGPMNIAFSGGNLYVTDQNNNRVQEFSTGGVFIKAVGWGVSDGKSELETCISSCKAGIAGSGSGQFNGPRGLTTEPLTGDLYVSEIYNNRVQEITASGVFVTKFGSGGSGFNQFAQPMGVAVNSAGGLYITDFENSRVQEWSRRTWLGTIAEGPAASGTQTFTYKGVTVEGNTVIEPTEELGPKPAGVSCSAEPAKSEKGCRELTFKYAEKTKENIGENPSEWGEYAGRLVKVLFTAYNPATGKMAVETPVAEYVYDKQGRLRAEWDPRITPSPLKTTYGYDAEGHVTAVAPPGQQPWLMHYGTIAGEANTGRLLSVIRPSASTALANGEAPKNTAVPTLSSTKPTVGTKISVSSNGTWSDHPLTYSYQWYGCNSSGKECSTIAGAVNQSYYPAKSDEGHTLAAQVSALNATGAVTASSAATSVVASGTENTPLPEPPNSGTTSVWTVDYKVPISGTGAPHEMGASKTAEWGQATDDPYEATAIFPPDEPMGWPAKDYTRAAINYRDSEGRTVNTASPTGGITTTEYNEANEVTRTLSADNRAAALKEGCVSEKECKSATESRLLDTENTYNSEDTELVKTLGPEHTVRLSKYESTVPARNFIKSYYDEGAPGGETYRLVTKTENGGIDTGTNEEFDVRTTTTSYSGEGNLGWKLRKPTEVTTDPNGLKLVHRTVYESSTGYVVETQQPEGSGLSNDSYNSSFGTYGSEIGELQYPSGITIDSKGNSWVVDSYTDRVEEFNEKGEYTGKYFGSKGTELGKFEKPESMAIDSKGNFWVVDSGNDRVEEFNEKGEYTGKYFGSKGTELGKFEKPWGIAIDSKGNFWVTDSGNDRVEEFNEKGEYTGKSFGSDGTGNEQFVEPTGIAIDEKGNLWVSDSRYYSVKEFSSTGEYKGIIGGLGKEMGHPEGVAIDARGNIWVVETKYDRVQEYSTEGGSYESKFGSEGSGPAQLKSPEGIAVKSSGEKTEVYVVDTSNSRVQKWTSSGVGDNAHDTRTFYYTAKGEAEVAACREHPEWAGVPCETAPSGQPETGGLPELPVTTIAYNMWDAPETVTEKVGSTTRTKKESFDAAGREISGEVTSSVDTALPKVTDEYNEKTGALEKQSATIKGNTKTITSKDNTRGQLVEYVDAEGNIAKYVYEEGKEGKGGDARLEEVSEGKGEEAKSKQTYSYDPTTGFMTKLVDSAAGTFTATYDVEGKMLTEGYPNGMNADYVYNASGAATSLEYVKATHCTEKCVWFSDAIEPSVRGETLTQKSTLSEEPNYVYDTAGRLTEVEEMPAGKGCKTRLYAYDEDSNRMSLTTREPGTEGKCATEGGTVESHNYDGADRLIDAGVAYETFGNVTKLSAADAGGNELASTYYIDGQVASQEQKKVAVDYTYDPAGRTMEAVAENPESKTKLTSMSHYAGPGEALTWTSEEEGGVKKWTRNIPGIGGGLDAIQESGKTPVLQLHDLQGNVVGTAALSETETKLLSTYNSTEFGVPSEGKAPPKYAWLGAVGVSSELTSSGTITDGGGSYVPEIARSLQTSQVVPPGAYPNGSGPGAPYTTLISPEAIALGNDLAAGAPQREAERQKAKAEEACRVDPSSCYSLTTDPRYELIYFDEEETFGIINDVEGGEAIKILFFLHKVQSVLEIGPVHWLEKLAGVHTPTDWAYLIAEGIYACGEAFELQDRLFGSETNSLERCEVTVPWTTIDTGPLPFENVEVPDLFQDPVVSFCLYYAENCGSYQKGEFIP